MDALLTQSEINSLLHSTPTRATAEREALRHAVIQARKDAVLASVERAATALARFARTIAAYPAQRRLHAELMALTPRELADIGLTRADIPRVIATVPPVAQDKPRLLRGARASFG